MRNVGRAKTLGRVPMSRADQTYVNAGFNPSLRRNAHYHGPQRFRDTHNHTPGPFKAAGRPPVKGGRWAIRRFNYRDRNGNLWRAYSAGLSKKLARSFPTHQEAADYVSRTLKAIYTSDLTIAQTVQLLLAANQQESAHKRPSRSPKHSKNDTQALTIPSHFKRASRPPRGTK